MNIENLNLIEYLDDKNISYSTSGKNVSSGWIGISCPFCGDSSNHLGINLESKVFSCWKCGEKGNFIKLAMELEGLSFKEIMKEITPPFPMKYFAYPYGRFNQLVLDCVKEAGYEKAWSVTQGNDNPLSLYRNYI
jgi:hypothetical protein